MRPLQCALLTLWGVHSFFLASAAEANGWQTRGSRASRAAVPADRTPTAPAVERVAVATAVATETTLHWRPVRGRVQRTEVSYRKQTESGESDSRSSESIRRVQFEEQIGESSTDEMTSSVGELFARKFAGGRIHSSSNQRIPGPAGNANPFRDDGSTPDDDTLSPPFEPLQLRAEQGDAQQRTDSKSEFDDQPIVIDCELPSRQLYDINVDIAVKGVPGSDYPQSCLLGSVSYPPRYWPETVFEWKAASTCHKPLYFEEENLERYGHEFGPIWQPVYSGAHFFKSVVTLPYLMGLKTPEECVYTLGHYRPGNCAPKLYHAVPFTKRAAFFQGAFIGGLIPIIP